MTIHPCPYCGRALGHFKTPSARYVIWCQNDDCELCLPIAARTLRECIEKAKAMAEKSKEKK